MLKRVTLKRVRSALATQCPDVSEQDLKKLSSTVIDTAIKIHYFNRDEKEELGEISGLKYSMFTVIETNF